MRFFTGLLLGTLISVPATIYLRPPEVIRQVTVKQIQPPDEEEKEEAPFEVEQPTSAAPISDLSIEDSQLENNSDITIRDLAPPPQDDYTIQSGLGNDGYRLDRATVDRDVINLKVYKYRSAKDFRKALELAGEGNRVDGLSFWHPGSNECVILIEDPVYRYKPSTIGHEITHCIYGDFHKER